MSQFFQIHPETPQKRLIHQAAEMLRKGALIVYPTDSGYALGCVLLTDIASLVSKNISLEKDIETKNNEIRITFFILFSHAFFLIYI